MLVGTAVLRRGLAEQLTERALWLGGAGGRPGAAAPRPAPLTSLSAGPEQQQRHTRGGGDIYTAAQRHTPHSTPAAQQGTQLARLPVTAFVTMRNLTTVIK